MPGFLKQSTAAQSRALGPFVDDTDFKTPETGLTIANTDIKLVVNGGASANKNSGGGTHRVNGVYGVTFDATDTATVGEMEVSVVVAGALPVFDKFFVVEEAVYDMLYAASALGYIANAPVNVAQLSGDSAAADNAEAFFDGTGYAGTNNVIPTVTSVTGVAAGGIAAASFAAGAIDAAAIAANAIGASEIADGAIDAGAIAADAITAAKIADGAIDANTFAAGAINAAATAADFLAEVNAEVVDALNTDTYAEPGQGTPAATVSLAAKIGYLYKAWRNKHTQTATEYALYADDGTTKDQEAGVGDDGVTFTRNEMQTGA